MHTASCCQMITLYKNTLWSTATNIVKMNGTTALTKVGIGNWTITWIGKMIYYATATLWIVLCVPYPSCLQTTLASVEDQESSHTVPHTLFRHISTLPSYGFWPFTSLRSPSKQVVLVTWHLTPASSLWSQLLWLRWLQSSREDSLPLQWTLSKDIGPTPWPKYAVEKASAPKY